MKHILLVIFLFTFLIPMAQLPEYYVYLVKGNVLQKKPNGPATPVKQKELVYKTDVLIINKDAALTLVNKEQKNLVLTEAGSYRVADLGKKLHVSNTGITKKYLNLLWHELLDPNYDYSKLKKENLAASWGGVSRGDLCNNRIFPINGLKTSADSIHFRWEATSPSSIYTLQLFNGDGTEVMTKELKDTLAVLPVKQVVNSRNGKYYWLVKSNDGTCEDEVPLYFEILSKDEEVKLIQGLLALPDDGQLIDKFQNIDRLEKQALINAASSYFRKLVSEHRDNDALKKSYVSFLLKYGFEDEAEILWNEKN